MLDFDEIPIRHSVSVDKVKQPLKCFALETFQQLANCDVNRAAAEEESGGEYRKPEGGRETSLQSSACPLAHTHDYWYSVLQDTVSVRATSLGNIKK